MSGNAALRLGAGLTLLGFFLVLPAATSTFYYSSLGVNVLTFGLLAMSLDLLAGTTGLLSFGHAAYLGLGAYGVAYAEAHHRSPMQGIGLALVLVLVVALAFGCVAVRATGMSFGMVTLSLGGVLWGLAFRWTTVTGGENGLPILFRPRVAGLDLNDQKTFYYVTLAVVALSALTLRTIAHSPFGLSLRGIKGDERRMRTLGYGVGLHKYVVYVVTAFFAGIAGILFGFFNLGVTPSALDLHHNFFVLMMVVLGGIGTLWGALLGAAVVELMQLWLSISGVPVASARWQTVMGVCFILVVMFARGGIMGLLELARRLVARHLPRRKRIA
jgi:branched-chain amino acid transport system permease protein